MITHDSLTLVTERLTLERLSADDADFMFELVNTEQWIRFIGNRNVSTVQDAAAYIERILNTPTSSYWVARLNDGTPTGIVTLIKRDYLPHRDLGFAFLPRYFNKGYATEAARAVLNHLAPSYESASLLATTLPDNSSSVKLLTRLGFKFEKQIVNGIDTLNLFSVSADQLQINAVVDSFFKVFENRNQKVPDWNELNRLCIPEVLFISKTVTTHQAYTMQSFIEPRREILTDGTLTDFEEHETSSATDVLNGLAQRRSEYSKSGVTKGQPFTQSGRKLFQFVKTADGWKISSVVWQDN